MSISFDHMKFYAHIYYKVYVCIATLNQDTIVYLGKRPHMFRRSSHGQFRTSTFGKNIFNVLKVFDTLYNKARAEGSTFEKSYLEDVQFVVSRTNHHFHKLNRKGERVPLSACLPKTKKKVLKCKQLQVHPSRKHSTCFGVFMWNYASAADSSSMQICSVCTGSKEKKQKWKLPRLGKKQQEQHPSFFSSLTIKFMMEFVTLSWISLWSGNTSIKQLQISLRSGS